MALIGAGSRVVAVTGGSGFIGQRLVALHLGRGDRVRLLSRTRHAWPDNGAQVTVVRGDLTDEAPPFDALLQDAELLYHCAGELRDETKVRAVHVAGTAKLLEAATGRIKR